MELIDLKFITANGKTLQYFLNSLKYYTEIIILVLKTRISDGVADELKQITNRMKPAKSIKCLIVLIESEYHSLFLLINEYTFINKCILPQYTFHQSLF